MYKGKKVAVVMTCLNESGKIGGSVRKIRHFCKGLVDVVVVVDDGSTDDTGKEAEKAGARVLTHTMNKGAGAGYRSGYLYSLAKKFHVTVEMAGDDQDDARDVLTLIQAVVDDGYDYVHGSRWLPGGKRIHHPVARSILTRLYSLFFAFCTGYPATDATNGIRAFRTNILYDKRIRLEQSWLNRYELEPYFFYKVVTLGYRVGERPVSKRYHLTTGSSKMIPIKSWWSISRPLFFLSLGLKT